MCVYVYTLYMLCLQGPIPETIGSDLILWSWSADLIPQTPIKIGSSDRENTNPNSLLLIESWYKSFIVKFRTEIMQS